MQFLFLSHYNYLNSDVQNFADEIVITTEKDWMRLKETKLKELCSVEIFRLQIGIHILEDKDKLAFEKQINRLLK